MLFIDRITFFSLLRLWALSRQFDAIWHFEPLSPHSRRLLGVFRWLGLLHAEIRRINHHIGQVHNQSGDDEADDMEYIKIIGEARTICSRIRREHLSHNPLINAMSSTWSVKRLVLHFEKIAEVEITTELVRISLVGWIFSNRSTKSSETCILVLGKKRWYSYIEPYARSQGIEVISYRNPWNLAPISKVISLGMAIVLNLLKSPLKILRAFPAGGSHSGLKSPSTAQARTFRSAGTPTVAIRYWYRTLDLDPTKRSEFFWLGESGIPYSNILLYDYVSDEPLDEEIKTQLDTHGIRILGRGPGVDSWRPTLGMFSAYLGVTLKLIKELLGNWLRFRWTSTYYLVKCLQLASRYAYWYDFYRTNGIRIDVAVLHRDVAQVLALDSVGGVSVGYQYTVGSYIPTTIITCGENVQFVFSPLFERQYRDVEAPVDNFVATGFIYDGAIRELRNLDRITEVRKQLGSCGASFVLCFFDENSVSDWNHPSNDVEAAADYEYLLNWLLADPALGIVFKPKNSTNLFERIAPLSDLIDQAVDTGRCRFLTDQSIYGSIYPAEAALIADVCIGKLVGGSAGFEARLAGLPTVMIDTEGYHSHPFHAWGDGRIIFDDWTSLRGALERFREDPVSSPEFGDWSPVIGELDPFCDGQASARMGAYIRWIYNSLQRGEPKEKALAEAANRYAQQFRPANSLAETFPPAPEKPVKQLEVG